MKKETFCFDSVDNQKIFTYKWIPDTSINGIIQITHGMAEHAQRYETLAEFLTSNGYIVYANDHRGHGLTAGDLDNVGYFSDKDGWNKTVEDMHTLTKISKKENPNVPLYIIGHSMGSFLLRDYIIKHSSEVNGIVLSGTTGKPGFLEKIGIILILWEILIHGKKGNTKLMWNMTFGKFNKPFKNANTPFDWLSRDEKEVNDYYNDKYCGGVFTPLFFKDMLYGINKINNEKLLKNIKKDLAIFLIAGSEDTVCNYGKGTIETYNTYKQLGMKNIKLKIYENARHALIHEINKKEVYEDILKFFNNVQ